MKNSTPANESFTLEPPRLDQVEELAQVRAQSWMDAYPNEEHDVSREWVRQRVNERSLSPEGLAGRKKQLEIAINNPSTYFFRIAKTDNGEIVGFAEGEKQDRGQELLSLYVAKKHYGSGVAQLLTKELMEWFDLSQDVELEVVSYNARAIAFYHKIHFEKIPEYKGLYADKVPTIRMIRKAKRNTFPVI